jgi:hypothetical protein
MTIDFGRLEPTQTTCEEDLSGLVDDAVAPLRGVLSGTDLEMIRVVLRDALDNDPVLLVLAKRARAQHRGHAVPSDEASGPKP